MNIRRIAAAAGFATGAALAFAPLASADPSSFVTSTLDSEIASQNSLLESAALFTGNTNDITVATVPGVYDTIDPSVVPQTTVPADVTALEYFLYGVNPIEAGISSASGPYNEFNGALTEFYDAYNVYAYALGNGGALDTNLGDYLGSTTTIGNAVSGEGATLSSAAQYFFNFGVGDLKGYLGDFGTTANSAASAMPAATDIGSTLTSEINGLNGLFGLDATLAGIPSTDIIRGTGPLPFDTIDPSHTNSLFDTLVFGLNPANVSLDPGSYDVFNGALTQLSNAYNVELYSLLNAGGTIPLADIFGTHDFLGGGVATAVSEYLQLGLSDLAGYFDIGALAG